MKHKIKSLNRSKFFRSERNRAYDHIRYFRITVAIELFFAGAISGLELIISSRSHTDCRAIGDSVSSEKSRLPITNSLLVDGRRHDLTESVIENNFTSERVSAMGTV